MTRDSTTSPQCRASHGPQRTSIAQQFRVHDDFVSLLKRHGLDDCDALCGAETGTPLRRLRHRENWRLDLGDGDGTRTLYLKKHRFRTVATWFRATMGLAAPPSPARFEAQITEQLALLGVPTMTVAAYAETLCADGTLVAAFLSDELKDFEQLDLFLPKRFRSSDDPHLRPLILNVADVAGRFHRLGFNHRDFYTCHFFIREAVRGNFAVHLIDLQRVQKWPQAFRRRWHVKDLAQLAYSTHPRLIRATDRLRFLLRYLGADRLDARSKGLARQVLRKAAALQRKHGSYRDWAAAPLATHSDDARSNSPVHCHEDRACA